jgi:hypothetical protein
VPAAPMIKDWIERISKPREELGGMSVCPFAKGSKYEVIETDGSDIDPPPRDFELIIYKLPDEYEVDELADLATKCNSIFPDMIFLPDHKDRETFINGVATNNGKYNLILCQWRNNLNKARSKLAHTKYYSFWDKNYLDEITK